MPTVTVTANRPTVSIGAGVVNVVESFDTEAGLLAASRTNGKLAYAADSVGHYARKGGAWSRLADRNYVDTTTEPVATLSPSGSDDLALVSEAIADASDGTRIHLTSGTFLFSGQLPQRKDIRLAITGTHGDANGSPTYLQFTHSTSAPCILLDGTGRSQSGVTGATLTLRDLTVVAPATSDAGIEVYGWSRWSLFNIHVRGGSDCFLFDQAYIGTLWGCKGENAFRDGLHAVGNNIRGYGCQFVHNGRRAIWASGVSNRFHDLDLTRNGYNSDYGLARGGVYFDGQKNKATGYFETGDDGATLICEFERGSLYNDAEELWGLGSFKDRGVGNKRPFGEGLGGPQVFNGRITNLQPDSSFEAATLDGEWSADSGLTTSLDATKGVSSGRSAKLINTVAGSYKELKRYLTPQGGAGIVAQFVAGDVIVVRAQTSSSRELSAGDSSFLKIRVTQVGGGTPIQPNDYIQPYVNSDGFIEQAFIGVFTGTCTAALLCFGLSAQDNNDTAWVTDIMTLLNPPPGVDPLRIPYPKTGPSGAARTAVIEAPFFLSGKGSPEGAVTACVGTLYSRLDGSTSTTLYVKTSGTGNTGWTAK